MLGGFDPIGGTGGTGKIIAADLADWGTPSLVGCLRMQVSERTKAGLSTGVEGCAHETHEPSEASRANSAYFPATRRRPIKCRCIRPFGESTAPRPKGQLSSVGVYPALHGASAPPSIGFDPIWMRHFPCARRRSQVWQESTLPVRRADPPPHRGLPLGAARRSSP